MTATLVVNADLGNFSAYLGAAERLPDGNFVFTSGFLGSPPNQFGQTIEVLPDGTMTYELKLTGLYEYRSYMMPTLYGSPGNLVDPGFEDPPQGTGSSAYQYNPTGSAWSFSGTAGLAGNGSAITSGTPDAPQGSQVAFIQKTGTISQVGGFHVRRLLPDQRSTPLSGATTAPATRRSRCRWTARWWAPSSPPAPATPPTRPPRSA